jgi:hypothetical protein
MNQISPPHREPNGRRQRSTQDELNEINRAKAEAEQSLVLSQPHRKGDASPMAESPIGRFITQFAMERELYGAAVEYARIRGMWLSVIRAPRIEHHDGSGGDVSEELEHKWRDDTAEWRRAMVAAGGEPGARLVEWMACDHIDLSETSFDRPAAQVALRALGRAMGFLPTPNRNI